MIVGKGMKLHIVYRALYENSTRRHFLGEVVDAEGAVCRVEGYAFILDRKTDNWVKRHDRRTTIVDLSESGYVVNVIEPTIDLDRVRYRYLQESGLVITDDADFTLNVNEFSARS